MAYTISSDQSTASSSSIRYSSLSHLTPDHTESEYWEAWFVTYQRLLSQLPNKISSAQVETEESR
ncbi:MAG: hypothetical protein AAFO04_13335 [Cyanobacteria bacterium J06592_8]